MLPHAWLAEEWAVPTEKSIRGAGDGMGRVGHPLAGRAGSADVPSVSREIRALVCHMARANPLWGAPRIHGQLTSRSRSARSAGFCRAEGVRGHSRGARSWRTMFLASMDFFVVPTATFRALFVLLILAHERRLIVQFCRHRLADGCVNCAASCRGIPMRRAPALSQPRSRRDLQHRLPRAGQTNGHPRGDYGRAFALAESVCRALRAYFGNFGRKHGLAEVIRAIAGADRGNG